MKAERSNVTSAPRSARSADGQAAQANDNASVAHLQAASRRDSVTKLKPVRGKTSDGRQTVHHTGEARSKNTAHRSRGSGDRDPVHRQETTKKPFDWQASFEEDTKAKDGKLDQQEKHPEEARFPFEEGEELLLPRSQEEVSPARRRRKHKRHQSDTSAYVMLICSIAFLAVVCLCAYLYRGAA